mmetsp:Transcript_26253/g.37369  ORF Transcript_26253/g.37369 Transcript_26253/m.37369 type:complete len:315 (-) Transcript_26253:62-1006(-)|eukprot:CAMPEP_0175099268 /NCGR_PEP_ID=MMETSP0086_2-20121207/6349_1 /TAXON_ID=136419 /ORGANISM="Unknown Unknown, Strain D1" /LENGTH=314 /DNA_ID=CAMNT_0016373073 /DNA_START=57 /DNA_END=1001 /DNA_ORIENTATION=+
MNDSNPWDPQIQFLDHRDQGVPALESRSAAHDWKRIVFKRLLPNQTRPMQGNEEHHRIPVHFLVLTGNSWCGVCQKHQKRINAFVNALSEAKSSGDGPDLKTRIEQASDQETLVTGVTHHDFPTLADFQQEAKNQALPGNVRITSVPSILVLSPYVTSAPFTTRLDLADQAVATVTCDVLATYRKTRQMAARAKILLQATRIQNESVSEDVPETHQVFVKTESINASPSTGLSVAQDEVVTEFRYILSRNTGDQLACDLHTLNQTRVSAVNRWRCLYQYPIFERAVHLEPANELLMRPNLWEQMTHEVNCVLTS